MGVTTIANMKLWSGEDFEYFKLIDSENEHWGSKYKTPPAEKRTTAALFLQTKYCAKSENKFSGLELQLRTMDKLKHFPSSITVTKKLVLW